MKLSLTILSAALLISGVLAQAGHIAQAKQLKNKQIASVVINDGYKPESIQVKVGTPLELTFVAGKDLGCGGTVVIPSLKISKDVPVGKSIVIKFTPKTKGDIAFTCGMGMLHGKLVVK